MHKNKSYASEDKNGARVFPAEIIYSGLELLKSVGG
jgi:hypothetical protein